MEQNRCPWPAADPLMIQYHDTEWGVPLHDDHQLFEFLVLEGMQAGLSWHMVLHKRENFRKAFDRFNPKKVAKYDERKVRSLLNDAGIIRNQLKIRGTINNAQRFLEVQKEFGSFDDYVWGFVNHKTIQNKWKRLSQIPVISKVSGALSADLKERGFKFIGSTVCYAHMQATGMVNDHLVDCFRWKI